jgi:DNA (cytosine-5)-methyltransferase 1
MKIATFFAGAGGLDRGFEEAGFDVVWANEYDKAIWDTYRHNFPGTKLDTRSIVDVEPDDIPTCDGMIGGPPCQSWSEAGMLRGIEDHRGQLFFEYIRLLEAKRPLFFLAENVSGIVFNRHSKAFNNILQMFSEIGYNVSYHLLNANDYGVPQDRERVIIVGYLAQYGKHFEPPAVQSPQPTLKDAIWDLRKNVVPAIDKNKRNPKTKIANHEYFTGGFSSIFMSRNRVRPWHRPSFTIQAGGRHAPLHPQAPEMVLIGKDARAFVDGADYRRLSVRECARVQTFPDEHLFIYDYVADGYKMIGNAVPVKFASALATQILQDVSKFKKSRRNEFVRGSVIAGERKKRRRYPNKVEQLAS